MKKPIYLDSNATTPLDPKVLEKMMPYLKESFGNPSSQSHSYGWEASLGVERARKSIMKILAAKSPLEIVFTSGATESNNLAILGLARSLLDSQENGTPPHMITSIYEHKAVLEVFQTAAKMGMDVSFISGNEYGQILPQHVVPHIKKSTRFISFMAANNEIGTINPLMELGQMAKKYNLIFHTDAAQAAGKIAIDVQSMNIHMLSISGHKIYGPKGVGALYISKSDTMPTLKPLIYGGLQEQAIRPGTLNVPGIVGLGAALEITHEQRNEEAKRMVNWRNQILTEVQAKLNNVQLNGHPTERLCNNLSLTFKGLSADIFAIGLGRLAVSSGSACSSGDASPSHVLKGLGLADGLAKSTLRIGLSRFTTEEDIKETIQTLIQLGDTQKRREISAQ